VAGLRKGSNWQDVQWGLFMSKYIFPGADASTPLYWYTQELEKAGFEVSDARASGMAPWRDSEPQKRSGGTRAELVPSPKRNPEPERK
jgi:hypothetical protein